MVDNAVKIVELDPEVVKWVGLTEMTAQFLVDMLMWATIETPNRKGEDAESESKFVNAILREAERRGWPECWWEDASIVLGLGLPYRPPSILPSV